MEIIIIRSETVITANCKKGRSCAVSFPESQLFVQLMCEDIIDGSRKIFHKFIHCLPPPECIRNSVIYRHLALFQGLLNQKHRGSREGSGYSKFAIRLYAYLSSGTTLDVS